MRLVAIRRGDSRAGDLLVDQSYRLRARVFQERLNWDVATNEGLEVDAFDKLDPTYILAIDDRQSDVLGCARLLPGTGPMMLSETFPQLIERGAMPTGPHVVESSRFCVDTASLSAASVRSQGVHRVTASMFAGILEWSVANGFSVVATVTDLRLERIFRKTGLPFLRLGEPQWVGITQAVAGIVPATPEIALRMRPPGYVPLSGQEFDHAA